MKGIIETIDFATGNTNLPYLPADPILTTGSLLLIDFSNPQGWDNGAGLPGNGSTVPNPAWRQARDLLGSGTRDSLMSTVVNNMGGSEISLQYSAKKGLHIIQSQSNQVSNHFFHVRPPVAVTNYILANPTHKFAPFLWGRITRAATDVDAPLSAFLSVGGTGSMLYVMKPSGNLNYDEQYNVPTPSLSYTGNFSMSLAADYTGVPGSEAATDASVIRAGNLYAYGSLEKNKGASFIIYKYYLEDLTVSGRTFSEVSAIDQGLKSRAFAVGGRFYNDTFTAPSTLP